MNIKITIDEYVSGVTNFETDISQVFVRIDITHEFHRHFKDRGLPRLQDFTRQDPRNCWEREEGGQREHHIKKENKTSFQ